MDTGSIDSPMFKSKDSIAYETKLQTSLSEVTTPSQSSTSISFVQQPSSALLWSQQLFDLQHEACTEQSCSGCTSPHVMPLRTELTNIFPVVLHECTSNPMILIQYHTVNKADAYLRNIFFIKARKDTKKCRKCKRADPY